jgi:Flp pilus assembly protein TadD
MKACPIVLLAVIGTGLCSADSLAEALRSKRFQDALTLAGSLLQTQPEDPGVWTARGLALAGLGRDKESISSFETALRYSPEFAAALKGTVEVGYRSHDPRAAAFLDRLIRLEPENAVAHAMAGVLAFEGGDCGRAVYHFEKASAQIASNERAYSLYGACLLVLDRPSDAVPVFKKLLAAHPDSVNIRFNLGYSQLLAQKSADAIGTLQPFAADSGAGADALNLLAAAEAAGGRLEAAVDHLRRAIEIAPKDERSYLDLAAICLRNESEDAAAEFVDVGLQNVPESARLHTLRGILKAQLGKYEEAASEFELANRLDPNRQYGAAGLGVLYTEMRQPDLASAVLRERLKKSPGDSTLNYLLAQALVQEGVEPGTAKFSETLEALIAATRAQPAFAKAHSLLGKLYVSAENYPKAVEELRLAAKYDATDRMARSQLAIALRRLGRDEEAAAAIAELKRIIIAESHPNPDQKRIRVTHGADR